ncbi:plasma membrane localization protein [Mortierella claussenii]|nr:plasma membrane localization protein [Mortierella claussenii]
MAVSSSSSSSSSSITSSSITSSSTSPVPFLPPAPPPTRSRAASISGASLRNLVLYNNGSDVAVPPVPHPSATHSSFIPTRYVKHATLINNCYPARPEEKGPKSSELSYLVYYATSKPAKLTKVGTFIERRVARDYRKKRLSDVHCSLEIIKALLLASKAHLNIFSKNIVAILDTLLVDITDFDIVRHCQIVFLAFCSAHDGSTLGVDVEFRTLYEHVVAKFADIATLTADDSNRYRLVGLKALEGVVSSTALYACDYKAQLDLVLPAILDCLIDSKEGIHVSLEDSHHSLTPSPRPSTSTRAATHIEKEIADDEVTADALRCLHALFKTQNGGNVKQALGPTFSYLDEYGCWWPSASSVGIIKAILSAILPQFRYIVANEVIARIDGVDVTTPDMTLRLQKKASLISALETILFSSLTLFGMPVLEVLNSLLAALSKSLSGSTSLSKEGETSQLVVLETLIQDGLVRSVGGLATHIYYANQVPNILSHIVGKVSYKIGATPQPETIDGVPTTEYRKAQLRCLISVIKTSKDYGRQESGFHAAEISSELLTPCLGLLLDDHVGVRAAFAQALITFLATEDDLSLSNQRNLSGAPLLPSTSSDLYFRAATHQTLHSYARLATATPTDMAAIYGILRALFTHFQDDEFMRVVPVLFSLQDWCLEKEGNNEDVTEKASEETAPAAVAAAVSTPTTTITTTTKTAATATTTLVARKRALATVIVIYLQKAVGSYGMVEPQEYLDNIQKSRETESQWYPIYYENQESLTRTTGLGWEAPSEPLDPVLTHPLAREHLVTLLTTVSDRFRAGGDRFGLVYNPESQKNLLTAQATAASVNREFGNSFFLSPLNGLGIGQGRRPMVGAGGRIRVSRHLEDWALPKIIVPSSYSGQSSELASPDESLETRSTMIESARISRQGSVHREGRGSSLQAHKTIGVDNLRQALTAAAAEAAATASSSSPSQSSHQALDVNDTTSSFAGSDYRASSPVQKFYLLSAGQRSKQHPLELGVGGSTVSFSSNLAASRPDLADLLDTIQVNVPAKESSPLSLVTPPY